MPSGPLRLDKFDPEQLLINFQDAFHDDSHREILLHFRVVQIEGLLNIFTIVIPVIPDVEFVLEGKTKFVALPLFECEQNLALFLADGS